MVRKMRRRLARSAIWLTPKSVKEFSAADFAELGPERQRDLEAAAQGFLQVAKHVPADQPATVEQYSKGATEFRKLVEILGAVSANARRRDKGCKR